MEDNAYIGGAFAGLVYLVAGIRLTRLSVRTGELPERLLAATFLLWSVSYLFWEFGRALGEESLATPLLTTGYFVTQAGNVTLALFLRAVFRSRERWARWLVAGLVLGMIVGIGGSAWIGDWNATHPLSNPWYWIDTVSVFAMAGWMTAEGFHHYYMARQRLRLGLCDPLVCNRYLIWGLTGLTWVAIDPIVAVNDIVYELTGTWLSALDATQSVLEVVGIVLIWFVFFPPRLYQRWIGDAASTVRVEGS
jgi:putative Ca2+/H+ antiporter (TMEM165/GDT1 family)